MAGIRRGHRLRWAAAAVLAALVVGVAVFAAARDSGPQPLGGDPRVASHRLVAPFSMDAGAIQLTPAQPGYRARISYSHARRLIFAGAGSQRHAVFLATLMIYPGAGGAARPTGEPVWASAVRGVPQSALGSPQPGQPVNRNYIDVIAVDARTGRDVQQILIGKPDVSPSSTAPH
jgi:hypothetical protein